MKKGKITWDELRELIRLYDAQNIEGFQLLCNQYDLSSRLWFMNLRNRDIVKSEMIKYGIAPDDMDIIANFRTILGFPINSRPKLTLDQWSQLIKIYRSKNIEMFQSFCNQYGLDSQYVGRLLVAMSSIRIEMIKHGFTPFEISNLDHSFINEGELMGWDQDIENFCRKYKINILKLHKLYVLWYYTAMEAAKLVKRWSKDSHDLWDRNICCAFDVENWGVDLYKSMGEDEMKELCKLYL